VVAPSLIPKKAGDRVKTDRRDSLSLARLHRAGELTAVWVPDDAQEALRDLTRAREDMKHLQRQAKQRLLAFLLRHGQSYDGKGNWTQAHHRWLEGLKFSQPVQQIVFQEYVDTVKMLSQRIAALDEQMADAAAKSPLWPVIGTYRHPARKTACLQRRAERTPEAVQDIAWKAQKRLCARYRSMEGRGKLKVQACTAVARELAGFIWAIGQALPLPATPAVGQ
jgi:Transposase